jgi:Beta-lactamase
MVKPEAVGLSASRSARLDDVMTRRYVDSGRLPGVLTMVYRHGKLVHTGMSGHMDLESGRPMQRGRDLPHLFHEQVDPAVALMMLVEDSPIPSFRGPNR